MIRHLEHGALGLTVAVSLAETAQQHNISLPLALGATALSGIIGSVSAIEILVGLGKRSDE